MKADYAVSQLVDAIIDCSPLHELKFAINAVTDDDCVILLGDVDRPGGAQ